MATEKAAKKAGSIKIKWVVSDIGSTDDMRATIKGLGLREDAPRGRAPGATMRSAA